MTKCKTCDGRGYVRFSYPSNKPRPAYWFQKPCSPCDVCDGTGERGALEGGEG